MPLRLNNYRTCRETAKQAQTVSIIAHYKITRIQGSLRKTVIKDLTEVLLISNYKREQEQFDLKNIFMKKLLGT